MCGEGACRKASGKKTQGLNTPVLGGWAVSWGSLLGQSGMGQRCLHRAHSPSSQPVPDSTPAPNPDPDQRLSSRTPSHKSTRTEIRETSKARLQTPPAHQTFWAQALRH